MTKFSKGMTMKMGVVCLALGMGLASCSKEDAQVAPEAAVGKAQVSEANLKAVGPKISSSALAVGKTGTVVAGWYLSASEFGFSDTKYYLGDQTKPWKYKLPTLPSGAGSVLTLKLDTSTPNGSAMGQLTNLVVGQTYKISFSVLGADFPGKLGPAVYPSAYMRVTKNGQTVATSKTIDFTYQWNKWVASEVTFIAEKESQGFTLNTASIFPGGDCTVNLDIHSIQAIRVQK